MAPLPVLEHDSAPTLPADSSAKEWEEIEEENDNMLVKLQWEPSRQAFFDDLQCQIPNIRRLIAHHLSLSRSQQCEISDMSEWRYGSFNACIPVNISNWREQRLMLRCPFPYMQGGPDGLDEKIRLSNRPLTIQLSLLESSGIPMSIPRDRTYVSTDSYIRDILKCHDMKLRYQPNAIPDESEAESQMAVLTIMRALSPNFTMDHLQSGPFCHIWTDCHPSNILVNQRYDITCLFDLEWIPVLPIETLSPPFWLSGYPVDGLGGEKRKHYDTMCEDFLDIFGQEDDDQYSPLKPRFYTKIMKDALEKATHWFWASLNHPRVTYNLFLEHLQPQLAPTHSAGVDCIQFHRILAPYWTLNASGFIDAKITDHKNYLEDLRTQYLTRFVGSE
ncbi:hypothetical protein Z517_02418 [Fonsecaea pedrosoi CBS 271.37]|uniref:Aminoglycoside phosphotransferase domain-containing protein n=1 Tax=Fonsecaea pedrosoi CBS 271.37 TaxID=1442368 RepID=A0A0D2GQA9_9EURO|nr:uncharacterized protein Z517_02418 [Fonsecaea pedrosoi CBS 271.37]KIW83173.1 hypothetical protein Z517_02418 [Fonsecaea pedrosoi CBS 271.37]